MKSVKEKLNDKRFRKGSYYSTRAISQRIKPNEYEIKKGLLRNELHISPEWEHYKGRTWKYLGKQEEEESPQSNVEQMSIPLDETYSGIEDWKKKIADQLRGLHEYSRDAKDISKFDYLEIKYRIGRIWTLIGLENYK
jgi:hypothetical protein